MFGADFDMQTGVVAPNFSAGMDNLPASVYDACFGNSGSKL